MNVSIIMPVYKPNNELIMKIRKAVLEQEFEDYIELLEVSGGGLAENMNEGVKMAKYDLIITLHQDCIPDGKLWLKKLTAPFSQKEIVASVSKVYLPEKLWEKFDLFSKSLTLKEKGTITPLLDEKGCAYRKDSLLEINGFNEKNFRTAGEDFDIYLKIIKRGKIAYPEAKIIHIHPTNIKKRLKKEFQYANGFGTLVAIYGKEMHHWYFGLMKAIPLLGLLFILMNYPFKKSLLLFFPYLIISPLVHVFFVWGFWKGFLTKRQEV